MTTIIMIAAFVGVAALVGGISMIFRGNEQGEIEERLDAITNVTTLSELKSQQDENSGLLSSPLDDHPSIIEEFISRFGNIRALLDQADAPLTVPQFLMVTGGLALGGVMVCTVLHCPMLLTPFVALALACLPLLWLIFRRKKRLNLFAKQLPDALELIGRALRAGHSLASGFSLVAEEMSDPIGVEFTRAYESQNLGVTLEDSLEEMTKRVPNLDLRFFATAVILQRQTGGDLAEILDKIGRLIRERFRIWGQIQALTGEGRLSGIVLLALPPVLFLVMYRLNPEYCQVLWTDELGKQMLAAALVFQVLGALVIRKIIDIKV